MKKSVFSVFAALSVVALTFMSASCGSSEDNQTEGKNTQPKEAGFETSLNIRYVDVDSVAAAYEYVKQEKSKLEEQSFNLQQKEKNYTAQLQSKWNNIMQKRNNNGYFSEASYQQDVQEYQALEQQLSTRFNNELEALNRAQLQLQAEVMDAIIEYIAKYNADKKYDAVLPKSIGLYFNPSLDITDEIIKGLNGEFNSKDKEEKTAKEDKPAKTDK